MAFFGKNFQDNLSNALYDRITSGSHYDSRMAQEDYERKKARDDAVFFQNQADQNRGTYFGHQSEERAKAARRKGWGPW